jgi:hypothetical protein
VTAPARPGTAPTPTPSAAQQSAAPATGNVALTLEGANTVKVGEEATLNVRVKADQPLVSAAFQIAYDPKAVKLLDVSEGDLLKSDGAQTTFSARRDDAAGMVFVGLSRPTGAEGSSGEGTLVQVRVQGLAAAASAPVKVTGFSAIGPNNHIVPAPAAAAAELAVEP